MSFVSVALKCSCLTVIRIVYFCTIALLLIHVDTVMLLLSQNYLASNYFALAAFMCVRCDVICVFLCFSYAVHSDDSCL